MGIPSFFGLKGMAIAGAVGLAVGLGLGATAAHRWYQVDTLKLQASIDRKAISDQAATIGSFREAASQTAALELAERQRATFAQLSIDALQKEADDAAAVAAANAAHRPDSCFYTPAELDGLRQRLR